MCYIFENLTNLFYFQISWENLFQWMNLVFQVLNQSPCALPSETKPVTLWQ